MYVCVCVCVYVCVNTITIMRSQLTRSYPYLQLLMHNPPHKSKKRLIQTFPNFVIDDIVEILYNLLFGNVPLRSGRQKAVLSRYRKPLITLFNRYKNKRIRRNIVREQSGGFIGSVIPIVASILASTLL